MIKHRHTGLVVNDLNKQKQFYVKILGLKIYRKDKENKNITLKLLNTKRSLQTVKLGDEEGVFLEILKYSPSKQCLDTKQIYSHGFSHIAFHVDDLDKIVAEMIKNDIGLLSKQIVKTDKHKVIICRDYEGNFIELVQTL